MGRYGAKEIESSLENRLPNLYSRLYQKTELGKTKKHLPWIAFESY